MNATTSPSSRSRHLFCGGQVVGHKYRLVRQIDEGGMGQVWIAEHIELDAHVAVKLLRAGHRKDAAERLKREARVLAQLEHPAIVRVLDTGSTEEGAPFLVTELLHGETLADMLWQNRRFSPHRAVQTLLPIIEGLTIAHENGIVHRDLKPANVFVARLANGRQQPKVLDFGIAAVRERRGERATAEGVLLGSPVYMSPEQARGLDVDVRTDIWALCVLLYEMVTGVPPFEGRNHHTVLQAVVQGEPRSLAEQQIDELALWAIIKRGMAKDPKNRWQDTNELGRGLAEWLVARGITEDAARSSIPATWLTPDVPSRLSSCPPVAMSTDASISREAETLDGDTPSLPAPRRSSSGTGRFWEVSVRRSIGTQRVSTLAWLVAGVLVGAGGAFVYASAYPPASAYPSPATQPAEAPASPYEPSSVAEGTEAERVRSVPSSSIEPNDPPPPSASARAPAR